MSNSEQGRFAFGVESLPKVLRTEAEHDLELSAVSKSMQSKLGPWLRAMIASASPEVDEADIEGEATRLGALLRGSFRRVQTGTDRFEHRLAPMPAIDCVALVQANNLAHALADSRRLMIGLMEGRQPQMVRGELDDAAVLKKTIDSVLIDNQHRVNGTVVSLAGETPAKLTDAYGKVAGARHGDRSEYYGNRSRNFGRWPWSSLRGSAAVLPQSADEQPFQTIEYRIVGKNPHDITFHPSTESSLKRMLGSIGLNPSSELLSPAARRISPVQSA